VKLNANRQVSGTLRGFDQFMNVVLDKAHDDKLDVDLGMVVRSQPPLYLTPELLSSGTIASPIAAPLAMFLWGKDLRILETSLLFSPETLDPSGSIISNATVSKWKLSWPFLWPYLELSNVHELHDDVLQNHCNKLKSFFYRNSWTGRKLW
jgi:hypothetical protein